MSGDFGVSKSMECDIFSFSDLILLIKRQEGHLVCKLIGSCFVDDDDLIGALHELYLL